MLSVTSVFLIMLALVLAAGAGIGVFRLTRSLSLGTAATLATFIGLMVGVKTVGGWMIIAIPIGAAVLAILGITSMALGADESPSSRPRGVGFWIVRAPLEAIPWRRYRRHFRLSQYDHQQRSPR